MSLIDDIRKDREAGKVLDPTETALLAADELRIAATSLCIKANSPVKAGHKWATYDVNVMTEAVSNYGKAHAAYREATR